MGRFMSVKCLVVCIAAALMFGGCAKKTKGTSTLPEPAQKQKTEAQPSSPGFDTSSSASFNEAKLDDQLQREVNEKLKPIYFDFNNFALKPESVERLGIVAGFLRDHSNLRILVQGHCDERGSSEYNMGLGERRGRAAKDYLTNYGISSAQVEVTSFGKEQPASPGCRDDDCHAKNRRDEFKVIQ